MSLKSSPGDLQCIIQSKYYVNRCLVIVFRKQGQEERLCTFSTDGSVLIYLLIYLFFHVYIYILSWVGWIHSYRIHRWEDPMLTLIDSWLFSLSGRDQNRDTEKGHQPKLDLLTIVFF